jgi:hypothetical protein
LYFIKNASHFFKIFGKTIFTEKNRKTAKKVIKMSKNKKKNINKDDEAIKAYKNDFTNVKSDVNGSYTGVTENNEVPEQDADDL